MNNDQIDKSITGFVRNTLGCGCPDKVFEKIDHGYFSEIEHVPNVFRINIGDTLLVYIVSGSEEADYESMIELLVSKGKYDRDSHGFNRFRLVLSGDVVIEQKAVIQKAFYSLVNSDQRLHLHFVDGDALESIIVT